MTEDQISPTVYLSLAAAPATAEFIITIIFTGRQKKEIIGHAMSCLVMEDVSRDLMV